MASSDPLAFIHRHPGHRACPASALRALGCLAAMLPWIASAAAAASPARAPGTPPEEARSAERLYATYCAGCHGADLQGGAGPGLLHGGFRHGADDPSLAKTIRDGRPEGGMPGMGRALDETEIHALITFMRGKAAAGGSPGAEGIAGAPRDAVLQTELHAVCIETITTDVDTPWALAFLTGGDMLVTEKEGRLRMITGGRLRPEPIAATPEVWHISQGGLLDVAVHPDHAANGWIYLAYSRLESRDTGMVAVERGRIRGGAWVDREMVFRSRLDQGRPGGAQFGSRLALDGAGHLYITTGDRDHAWDAQDLLRPNGKIHRIGEDGRIPRDNPFLGRPDALPSLWSIGHRNPQGLALMPGTGQLWSTEHGPRGGDELNHIMPGRNYGWPRITHGVNYDGTRISHHTEADGLEQPARHWTPSIGISAITFYDGSAFPRWRGQLLMASLVEEKLRRLELKGGRIVHEEALLAGLGRVRDVATGPDGCLYVALNLPDAIVRLRPAPEPELARDRARARPPKRGCR